MKRLLSGVCGVCFAAVLSHSILVEVRSRAAFWSARANQKDVPLSLSPRCPRGNHPASVLTLPVVRRP